MLASLTLPSEVLAQAILLLAVWVVLPLGLRLIENVNVGRLWLPAAVFLTAAFSVPSGVWAALLAMPWLIYTLLLAAQGAKRLWRSGVSFDDSTCINVGLVYLAIGGAWTLVSRGGWDLTPLGFSNEIVLLTGVHFHYAGFVLPLLAGLATGDFSRKDSFFCFAFSKLLISCVIVGVPLVGVGITFSPLLEVVAALMLATACLMLALLQARLALQAKRPGELTLFAVSALSLTGGMAFATVFALGEYFQTTWIDIPTMIPLHGLANGVGFALGGIIAWHLKHGGSCDPR